MDVDYLLSQELAGQLRNGEFPEHFKTPATNAAAEHKDTVYISVVGLGVGASLGVGLAQQRWHEHTGTGKSKRANLGPA